MNAELLKQLRDIPPPEPVSMLPIAPGWIVIYCLILLAVSTILYKRLNYRKREKRLSKLRIDNIVQQFRQNGTSSQCVADVNAELKRLCIRLYGPESVSSLHGKAWLDFLDQKAITREFQNEEILDIHMSSYSAEEKDPTAYLTAVESWFSRI